MILTFKNIKLKSVRLVKNKITIEELKEISQNSFGNLVKAVVDIEKGIMVVDVEIHSDGEEFLLKRGAKQENLWGINIYPDLPREEMIEFDSMINLRPSFGNRSRGVDDSKIREKIIKIVNRLVVE